MTGDTEEQEVSLVSDQARGNIILIGMMGTGKSTVGMLVAETLGYEFVDLDHMIGEHEGRRIAEIFTNSGEEYFRKVESAMLKRALLNEGNVISTGGGSVLAHENTSLMLTSGLVVALTAAAEEIISRVGADANRPLLAGNAEERVRRLLEQRKDAYLFAHCTVDTSGLSAAQVSQHILMHYRG